MRNLPDYRRGFEEMARSVRPGGRVLCLEIARPRSRLARFMRWWFDRIVPLIGRVAGQGDAYALPRASVQAYPSPERIAEIMREAGLVDVRWRGLTGGIVTLHEGTVPPALTPGYPARACRPRSRAPSTPSRQPRLGRGFRWLLSRLGRHEHRRRRRARRRPAAGRVADPRPAPRLAGAARAGPARAPVRRSSAGVVADRCDRRRMVVVVEPRPGRRSSGCSPRRSRRAASASRRPAGAVRAGDGGDVRRHRSSSILPGSSPARTSASRTPGSRARSCSPTSSSRRRSARSCSRSGWRCRSRRTPPASCSARSSSAAGRRAGGPGGGRGGRRASARTWPRGSAGCVATRRCGRSC